MITDWVKMVQIGGTHYDSDFQPIEAILRWNLDFIQGNVVKYVTRWRKKGGKVDLLKALQYCQLGMQFQSWRAARHMNRTLSDITDDIEDYIYINKLNVMEGEVICNIVSYNLNGTREALERLMRNM